MAFDFITQIQNLKKRYEAVVAENKEIVALAETEDRAMTDEEKAKLTANDETAKELQERAENLKKVNGFDERAFEQELKYEFDKIEDRQEKLASPEYRKAFFNWLRTGDDREMRTAIGVGSTSGGYFLPYQKDWFKLLEVSNPIRKHCRVFKDNSITDYISIGDATTLAEDDSWADGSGTPAKVNVTPYLLSARTLVHERVLMQSQPGIEEAIRQSVSRSMAVEELHQCLAGDGSQEGYGILTSVSAGKTTASATALTLAEWREFLASLDEQYHANGATLLMKRSIYNAIRALKEAAYQLSLDGEQPGQLYLDGIVTELVYGSDLASSLTASSKIAILMDLYHFVIKESDVWIKRVPNSSDGRNLEIDIFKLFGCNTIDTNAGKYLIQHA